MSCKSNSCSCAVSTASTGFQLMMRQVCMASLYLSSSVHTGETSSKALTKTDVMHKQFLQLCCFYSIHRVSAHDAACWYGIVVYVEQRPHWRCQVCCILCLTPGNTRCDALPRPSVLCNSMSRKPTFSYVVCLRTMAHPFSIENRLGRPVWSTTH